MYANTCKCFVCGRQDCDDDCEELREIYRARQREMVQDIDVDEIFCEVCRRSYAEASHEDCWEDHEDCWED